MTQLRVFNQADLDEKTRAFYCEALGLLTKAKVPFLIGGAYAFERYTGIARHTKDLDIFMRQQDCQKALDLFASVGYETELAVPHWLAKAHLNDRFVDIIFNSAAGHEPVDDRWIEQGIEETVLDMPVKICAPEDMIWSKSFVMSRDRYDGSDIAHLLLHCAEQLDWKGLIDRFDHHPSHWRVLFSHLTLFGFIYPGERSRIPAWVMQELMQRLQQDLEDSETSGPEKLCQGTMLSATQYQIDIEEWGYQDARLQPIGGLRPKDVDMWIEHLEQESEVG